MRSLVLCLLLALPVSALAQESTVPVPQKHIPATVLLELRALERQFDSALIRDCAPERCVSKGCVYRDHAVVDMPRSSSLPGIGQSEGPGSVPVQEYLTEASCDFAHEKSVSARDVQGLVRRLEQRLSKGWLKVTVGRQVLEPISPTLSEPPAPKPEPVPPPKVEPPPPAAVAPTPPAQWESGVALRELWVSLLPHFAWMIAVVLGTVAALIIIWALRRLGKESLEEKAMLAQMAAGTLDKAAVPVGATASGAAGEASAALNPAAEGREEAAFVAEQRRLWAGRMTEAELAKDKSVVVALLRQWLKAGEFELLAKAIVLFGDKLSSAFSSEGELAMRKVGFAEYLRHVDEKQLPSDAEFFRKLNHHAICASLLSQSDAESYRSIREEFGSRGIAHLIESLTPRHAALLFALAPSDSQHEVARTLSPALQMKIASQLLSSNRMSPEEQSYLFEALDAARAGRSLPHPPESSPDAIRDRGHEFDAAGALSVLFTYIGAEDRQSLLTGMLQRSSGAFPAWYQDILYPDMLLKLPRDVQADMLLEVDVKVLAGWSSVQQPAWRESFISTLAPSMQNAVRANMAFSSPEDQFRMARRGHDELVSAVKRLVAGGRVSFTELVS
ncbi:hypothetical protein [Hyalangium versicolor]|uniref:hypothetical protein n=1 Tax=Hyalangium versicolor TaxID=2861190 RepID=UPI001CCF193F|nr:hypothetical protein [Hyalangium versicolor]